jgi:hypothetical protein
LPDFTENRPDFPVENAESITFNVALSMDLFKPDWGWGAQLTPIGVMTNIRHMRKYNLNFKFESSG